MLLVGKNYRYVVSIEIESIVITILKTKFIFFILSIPAVFQFSYIRSQETLICRYVLNDNRGFWQTQHSTDNGKGTFTNGTHGHFFSIVPSNGLKIVDRRIKQHRRK